MKKILLITDNEELLNRFRDLLRNNLSDLENDYSFEYAYSSINKAFEEKYSNERWIHSIKIKNEVEQLIDSYDLIMSLHCKQLFPEKLVNNVKCINVHPGLNPYNRGWFPQVFSIINGLPCGATIHEIDSKLDHGPIICQKEVKLELNDTSLTAYNKILDAELELLSEYLRNILKDNYSTTKPPEGNLNLKKDFDELCEIDLNEKDTFLNHINKLRALTHGNYANAFFINEKGEKVIVKLELSKKEK